MNRPSTRRKHHESFNLASQRPDGTHPGAPADPTDIPDPTPRVSDAHSNVPRDARTRPPNALLAQPHHASAPSDPTCSLTTRSPFDASAQGRPAPHTEGRTSLAGSIVSGLPRDLAEQASGCYPCATRTDKPTTPSGPGVHKDPGPFRRLLPNATLTRGPHPHAHGPATTAFAASPSPARGRPVVPYCPLGSPVRRRLAQYTSRASLASKATAGCGTGVGGRCTLAL